MNSRVREIIKSRRDNDSLIHKYEFTIKYLEQFLKLSRGKFVLEKSINSLDDLENILNEYKIKLNDLFTISENLDEELRSICTHDVLFSNFDQVVCPLCEHWYFENEKLGGKYVIGEESLNKCGNLIQRYVDFLINYIGDNFEEDLKQFLENLQDKYDINILRR